MNRFTTELPHDHPAIAAIYAEIARLNTQVRDDWSAGMVQAYRNVLATIDPLRAKGGPRDDFGVGVPLPVPADAA